jgi:hypothetical protein
MGKIAAILPKKAKVVVGIDESGAEQTLEVRGLRLDEMMTLFQTNAQTFLTLYSVGMGTGSDVEKFSAFIVGAPELVSSVLEYALDPEDAEDTIAIRSLPPTVQLIAIAAAWKLSVPDPKKASELFSVVMAKLRTLSEKEAAARPPVPNTPSMNGSAETSNSLSATATASPTSGDTPAASSTLLPT